MQQTQLTSTHGRKWWQDGLESPLPGLAPKWSHKQAKPLYHFPFQKVLSQPACTESSRSLWELDYLSSLFSYYFYKKRPTHQVETKHLYSAHRLVIMQLLYPLLHMCILCMLDYCYQCMHALYFCSPEMMYPCWTLLMTSYSCYIISHYSCWQMLIMWCIMYPLCLWKVGEASYSASVWTCRHHCMALIAWKSKQTKFYTCMGPLIIFSSTSGQEDWALSSAKPGCYTL